MSTTLSENSNVNNEEKINIQSDQEKQQKDIESKPSFQLDPNFIQTFVNQNRSFFETALLLTIIKDFQFWVATCKGVLNQSETTTVDVNTNKPIKLKFLDFTKPIDNEIYEQIKMFYSTAGTNPSMQLKANRELILAMLAARVKTGHLTEQDFRSAEFRLNEIEASMPATQSEFETSVKLIVEAGFKFWFEQQRLNQISTFITKNKGRFNVALLRDTLDKLVKSNETQLNPEDEEAIAFESFSAAMDADIEENTGDRMPIATLPLLTKALGGGVLRGESGLVCSTSGGGKTVFACQFAIGTALNGFKTLYITTEQMSTFLVPRMLAATASIPFNKIKDGLAKAVKSGAVSKEEIERAKEVNTMVNDYLMFANWCKSGEKLQTGLESLILQKMESWGGIDCIIVDWLGGGIKIPVEAYDRRFAYYMDCVNSIKDLATKYGIFFLVLAQANKQKVAGRVKLDVDCIDGCNTLDQPLTWAAGISALQDTGGTAGRQKVNQLQEAYLRKQCMNIWKGRMNGAFAYPIYREFEFQRFVERETVELIGGMDGARETARVIDPNLLQTGGFNNLAI